MPPLKSPPPRRPRGFTLVELLVGAVTTSIILFAVGFTVLAVQGAYQTESRVKVAVEGARTATSFIEHRLRMAGYGVDPRFAFDFDASLLPGATKSNDVLELGTGVPRSVTDDLAFRYRDPLWLRRGTYDTKNGLQFAAGNDFGADYPEGQRFFVACKGGRDYVVLRARAGGVKKGEPKTANFDVDARMSSVSADASCLRKVGDSTPFIMMLHEMRIRIVNLGGRPFLMAFPSLETLDEATAIPLAADVESFQVAYVMNRPPPVGANADAVPVDVDSAPLANWVLGDVGSVDTDRIPDPNTQPAPLYGTSQSDAARFNRHPANIRSVRVSISVRSTRPEPKARRAFSRVALEDSAEGAEPDGYYRTNMTTTVRVPNLMSRSFFIPEVGAAPIVVTEG